MYEIIQEVHNMYTYVHKLTLFSHDKVILRRDESLNFSACMPLKFHFYVKSKDDYY